MRGTTSSREPAEAWDASTAACASASRVTGRTMPGSRTSSASGSTGRRSVSVMRSLPRVERPPLNSAGGFHLPRWSAPRADSLGAVLLDDVTARLRVAGCVFAEDEARLLLDAAADPAALEALVARRAGGEPLEQVLGWAEFCGLRIEVAPGVFVPRRRTGLVVREAVAAA